MIYGGDDDVAARNNRSFAVSVAAGFITGAGLWIFVDGAALGVAQDDSVSAAVAGYSWILPVVMLLAHVMVNGMRFSELVAEPDESPGVAWRARLFLMFALVLQIVVLAVAGFVMGGVYLNDHKNSANAWTGISIFTSQMLFFVSCWLQRIATLPKRDDI